MLLVLCPFGLAISFAGLVGFTIGLSITISKSVEGDWKTSPIISWSLGSGCLIGLIASLFLMCVTIDRLAQ